MSASSASHSNASTQQASSWLWVDCKCNAQATLKVVKNGGKHEGRRFYGCGNFPDENACKFFKWEEDVKSEKLVEQREAIDELVAESYGKSELLKKKDNLQRRLMADIADLKVKSEIHAQGERRALIALVMSWLFFVYYVIFY